MAGHVFLAYAREDRDYAQRLSAFLQNMAIDVWSDEQLSLGENWARNIERQIDTASAMIVVVSPAASSSTWVANEINYARVLLKPIFPILLAGPAMMGLRDVQHEDVSGGELPGRAFVDALSAVAGSPTPPPTPPSTGQATLSNPEATKVFLSYRRPMPSAPADYR